MAAGPELLAFQENLNTTTGQMQVVRNDVEALAEALDSAATAAGNYLTFRKIIKVLDAGFAAALTTLKLSENVAPLKAPSAALKDVLEVLQPRIVDIKDATDRAKAIEPLLTKFVQAEKTFSFTILPVVVSTDETLDNILAGIREISDAFARVSTPNGIPELNPEAGTERPGKDDFTNLFAEVDDFVAFANGPEGAAQDVFAAYGVSKAFLSELSGFFDIANFPDLNEIFGKLTAFEDLFDGLGVVLEIVESVLRPIQPLLDAVGLIFDTIVTPVVDFLKESIGLDDLFDALAAQLDPLFPDIDLFDDFLSVATRLEEMLDQLEIDFFDIPDFTDISLEVFDRFEETFESIELAALSVLDGIPVRIGDADAETMYGTGGDEAFDPQAGDDRVLANAGNDIIVASGGEDTILGGDGIDRLVFAGELAEYDFTRNDDTGELIFTHTDVGGHGFNEGTEIVTEVEYFDFGTETFTKEQFENAIVGVSVLDADGPVGEATTDEGELIFLNTGGTLISGLMLNGETFDNMNVVYGLGGNDRIQGTQEDDFIFGGEGNDLLIPRNGFDALDGGPGNDTFQVFDLGVNNADNVDLAEGTAFVRGGRKELFDVENVIIQQNGEIQLRGNEEGNVLFTGAGRDMIAGRGGNDAIFGNGGQDVIWGGQGVDTLRGGESQDFLGALNTSDNGAAELYDGEQGIDTLSYSTSQDEVKEFLSNNQARVGLLNAAMEGAETTGPVIIRASEGQIDRLNEAGGVIATDIALNIETFIGSDSDDVIFGGNNVLNNIEIEGGGGNDTLYSWGAKTVTGGRGDDLLIAERHPDGGRVAQGFDGGSGFDTLDLRPVGDAKIVIVSDTAGRLNLTVADKDDTGDPRGARGGKFNAEGVEEILLGDNDDWVEWGTGSDGIVRGGLGNDFLSSANARSSQRPTFFGDEGDDTIVIKAGGDAHGGIGDDRIEISSSGNHEAFGDDGNDVFLIERMDGTLAGGAGFDTLIINPETTNGVTINLATSTAFSNNGPTDVEISAITGIEAVITSVENDTVTGSDLADRISLRGGSDVAEAGDGNDQIFGGAGNDSLLGQGDNDTINGGTGNDTIDGGDGVDAVDYAIAAPDGAEGELIASMFSAAVVDLSQNTGGRGSESDTIRFVENVFGTVLNDRLTGDGADNVLSGGAGADTLIGLGGDDVLIAGGLGVDGALDDLSGGDGDDRLILGTGAFFADGGADSDTLDFSAGSDAADGGGRTLSIDIDLAAGSVQRDLELGRLIWAEGGGMQQRAFDGQSIAPTDVLRSDPLYARTSSDLDLRLPTGDEDADDIPSFAIEVESFEQSAAVESNAFTNIENVLGTARGDVMRGDGAANLFQGGDGDDLMEGRAGDDALEGGEGQDTAYFSGDQAQYTLSTGPAGTVITDRLGVNGTDRLDAIELLDFDSTFFDGAFNLEQFGGLGDVSAADLLNFIELYIAYFNRAPDAVGLNFWGTAFAKGTTLEQSASFFIDQDETRATYPSTLSNADFATSVYDNVLGRIPDQEGFDFWVGVLNNNTVSRDQFILEVLGGAKADPPDDATPEFIAQQQADRAYLADKTDIGTYFAVNKGMSDVDNAIAVMQLFDGTEASIGLAVDATDGFFAAAELGSGGEFLMPIIGILDDPFA